MKLLQMMFQVESGVANLPLMVVPILIRIAKKVLALSQIGAETHTKGNHGALYTFHTTLFRDVCILIGI
jgi:hypothetical protein